MTHEINETSIANQENKPSVLITSRYEEDLTEARTILDAVAVSEPGAYEGLFSAARGLVAIDSRNNPISFLNQCHAYCGLLDTAHDGIDVGKDHPGVLHGYFSDISITDSVIYAATISTETTDQTSEELTVSDVTEVKKGIRDQKKVSAIAKSHTEDYKESIVTGNTVGALDSLMLSCYATLLSGNGKMYQKLEDVCKEQFRLLDARFSVSYDILLDCIVDSPEKFKDIIAGLEEDFDSTYSDFEQLNLLISILQITNFKNSSEKIKSYKEAMMNLCNASIEFTLAYQNASHDSNKEVDQDSEPKSELEVMELDWEILPPGELVSSAREIVSSTSESKKATIELDRLRILENIRKSWGEDRCYYSKGVRKKRQVVRDGEKEQADEYIILVLQEYDTEGNVIAEHAVAESPIAGPNALYIQRSDVNECSWREIMALSKSDAVDMGARRLKHTVPSGQDMVTYMTEKIETLLSCSPEEFTLLEFGGLRNNKQRIRLPKSILLGA